MNITWMLETSVELRASIANMEKRVQSTKYIHCAVCVYIYIHTHTYNTYNTYTIHIVYMHTISDLPEQSDGVAAWPRDAAAPRKPHGASGAAFPGEVVVIQRARCAQPVTQ